MSPSFQSQIEASLVVIGALASQADQVEAIAARVRDTVLGGHLLLTCGNGGSATDAQHLAEELIGRYRSNRRALPAVALTADTAAMTCIANDFGFENVFARPCEALLGPADVLVLFTTSGRSENIRRAAEVGRKRGAWVVGLLGGDGGETVRQCDVSIIVAAPGRGTGLDAEAALDSAAIQEAHQVLLHILCERLERRGALQGDGQQQGWLDQP